MPRDFTLKKVLIIGSGPIVIGQAAEFDYAGTQACKAISEEGIETVLINSNPATIMTDQGIADKVYLEPITEEAVEQIIEKERPEGVLAGFGGQTGLNLAMALDEKGIFEKYGARLLGVNKESIDKAEDRESFKELMQQIGEPVPPQHHRYDFGRMPTFRRRERLSGDHQTGLYAGRNGRRNRSRRRRAGALLPAGHREERHQSDSP